MTPVGHNPYQPPEEGSIEPGSESSSLKFRRAHLGHEGAVRLFGLTILVPALFLILFWLAAFFLGGSSNSLGGALMGLVIAAFLIWLGVGIYQLEPATHKPGMVIAVLALFAFPMGTAIGAYLLYLLVTQKGCFVFSRGYRSLIAETPGLKAEAPLVIKILTAVGLGAWSFGIFSDLF